MSLQIDTVDEQILYYLSQEARHTSAPDIAEQVDVSAPTVRNRIRRLEEAGVIQGYHADVNYQKVGGRLTNQYVCTTGNRDREEMAQRVLDVPGVINVREIMSGKGDLRITVVGTDTDDLTRIAQGITSLGIEINDEDLVHREYFRPYAPFGPRDEKLASPVAGVAGLAGDADVVEVIVREQAPIAGKTLQEANEEGLIPSGVLVVRINRDEGSITPTGETLIKESDFVTIHSRSGVTEVTLEAFTGK
ncbi:winged helix-turn-helix transcriptional regulator [Haloferax mediterranei ATCC 33500]|uniref:AsnC family transcriptional regulator n=1 Tax=Haloferax mediterranei (strain ATCC 33500 / DSM 1411 / JCM 8866 / NBRC 14739 / NCIMB 2177 / R-4) TaxID=523841 RepID=I3R0Q5_HALMT|nr:winged helix-turn-helix transcriptional regulator [Haloferax mediterranei]AFK17815.1 lrp-type transcriptional regulator [Haloferax mediterranei ATCC 33500]AHZ22759.1 AsnC family transcriptional regulator [Haloferax mediterranei ATCC 33500]EMA02913.1 lrp-type transcriptional regulator [Haloferax mediterranei ATCC 33500]MDX5987904.1 winged helix-turn-helix transcriptional regulator [Haloferax mediterranei ATCC 33500]QCQ74377.1 winged helix-turn-helix transcriptional regulator [Haloferax medit